MGSHARPAAECRAPVYTRLNQILDKADFDAYVESLCQRFYADEIGRPGLPPGRYFRMLLLGYFAKDLTLSAPSRGVRPIR